MLALNLVCESLSFTNSATTVAEATTKLTSIGLLYKDHTHILRVCNKIWDKEAIYKLLTPRAYDGSSAQEKKSLRTLLGAYIRKYDPAPLALARAVLGHLFEIDHTVFSLFYKEPTL